MKNILIATFLLFTFSGFSQSELVYPVDENPLFNGATEENSHELFAKYIASCGLTPGSGEDAVYIHFVIDENGIVVADSFVLLKGDDKELYNRAIECLKKSPKWIPAQFENKNVACQYNVPIMK